MNTLRTALQHAVVALCAGAGLACAAPLLPMGRLGMPDTLVGILSYARWPHESAPLRLCVVGRSVHAERFLKEGLEGLAQRPIVAQRLALEVEAATQCDALYLGHLDDAAWRRLLPPLAGQAVLTVCERSSACAAGGMVSLDISDTNNVQFEVNLDAVARGGVRLNPQVLRLGRRAPKPTP